MQKTASPDKRLTETQMTETLVNGFSSEHTQQDLSNDYQHDRVNLNGCQKYSALVESSLSIERI